MRLEDYIQARLDELESIPSTRRAVLEQLSACVVDHTTARLLFVCTHNSRRSQMAQIWGAVAAHHFGADSVELYSGGTEATAFEPRAVDAVERAGVRLERLTEGSKPGYRIAIGTRNLTLFSKTFDDPANPKSGFCAVMTCSEADAACPSVPGAARRISLPYDDPKHYDGTDIETEMYDERCRQISREMLYVFSRAQWIDRPATIV